MQAEMIPVRCPSCSKTGNIKIDKFNVSKSPRGITAVNILNHIICDHSMIAYIDKNGVVRDCFVADFTVSLPNISLKKEIDESIVPDKNLVDVYLLTINLNTQFLTRVIRSCLLNQKVLILNELEILNKHILNFFDYMFQNTYKIDITLLNKQEYKKQKKDFKRHIILTVNDIIQDKSRILKPKIMKIENRIIQKFIEEPDPKSSLIVTKNEILKSYKLSNSAFEFLKTLKEGSPLKSSELSDHLRNIYNNVDIQISYLNFLVEIIERQHDIKIPDAADHITSF